MNLQGIRGSLVTSVAITATFVVGPAYGASGVWDVDVNPTNGFGGLTPTWGLTDADTVYAEWKVFDGYPTDTTPDVGSFGSNPQSVTETTGAAFLTGGGNIYSFSAATDFDLTLTGYSQDPQSVRTVALRLGLLGTDVDTASVLLGGLAPAVSEKTYTEILGGDQGSENEWLFIWTGVADALSYEFDFSALGSSMSLDQLAAYVGPSAAVVPVPAAAWLFGSALGLLGWVRSRVARA